MEATPAAHTPSWPGPGVAAALRRRCRRPPDGVRGGGTTLAPLRPCRTLWHRRRRLLRDLSDQVPSLRRHHRRIVAV